MSGDGFLSRWSRRKAQAREGARPEEVASPAAETPPAAGVPPVTKDGVELAPVGGTPEPPPPTLADVEQLTGQSDYAPFVARNVDDTVKRAALKKLFADPHFNAMDGLDTYIEDYGKPDPIPVSMLRRMAQAQSLGLFADEEEATAGNDSAQPKASPDGAGLTELPQSSTAITASAPDEDPDLRLQQDHAAGHGGPGPGAGA